ncbi:LuxR C-terminal-related transcriptional regulator [Kitasatospora sp. NPDC057198]|uniref:LuxR C-terminal-related transcriptional regulator n=1 Tax=Kitasatospora sp. NPDC057198 TaxID=3346046 RepID=UPI00362EC536
MTAHLPSESERALYREVIQQGGAVSLAEAMQQDPDAALGLIRLGLLVRHETDESLTAVNPRAVTDRLSAGLRDQAVRRLAQAERTASQLDDLVQAYDAVARRTEPRPALERLEGGRRIRHRIMQIEAEMREETLAAHPGSARPFPRIEQTRDRSLVFLASGVELRTIYQPGALTHRPTADYVATMSEAGERFRVLDEPFRKMLIFDRRTAIITASADDQQAMLIQDPAVLTTLVALFERDWVRAAIVDWHALAGRPRESGVPPELTDLLAAGLTQKAIASRLGLSERTVAAHLARLREHHSAETLFQLGWSMRGETR